MLTSLNSALGDRSLQQADLEEIFAVWWPWLEECLAACPLYEGHPVNKRPQEDILAEVLENSREQLRREEVRLERAQEMDNHSRKMFDQMEVFVQGMRALEQAAPNIKRILSPLGVDEKAMASFDAEEMGKMILSMREGQNINDTFAKKLISSTDVEAFKASSTKQSDT